ncbi:MAG: type II toxin-antitoxin system RelE/ParE family toxin [Acidobacteriia bacterium]|nr:type II toxin-antitoxin system RelE/ParE family toxin [Terriglobia bacterium]
MGWSVEILNSAVLAELDAFPADIRAKLDHIVGLIEELGIERVREPYVKHLRGQLWEMRMKGHSGLGRAIYVTQTGRRIIILHAFRKQTSKTPRTAIRTALSRMKELEP